MAAGGQAGIPSGKVVRRGQVVWGTPARPLDQFKRQFALLSRIGKLVERVQELETRLAELEGRARPPRSQRKRSERKPGGRERPGPKRRG